ncbi:MAG: LNS2 domain-containing protein [Polyangiales bacterium]
MSDDTNGGVDSDSIDSAIDSGTPSDGGEDAPAHCPPRPACDTPLPDVGAKRSWNHTTSSVTASLGSPRHRGRDLFLPAKTGPQWAIGKFAYGTVDKDIKDEDVDVWLLRDCGATWKKLGTYKTTNDGMHSTEEGVDDSGGRVYVDLASADAPLGVGRHRVHFVVGGDLSTADAYIEVLPDGAQIVVSDVDGTLTTSETASYTEVFGAAPPDANPGSPEALSALADRGYYVFYLTARPDWFAQKTRDWFVLRGFPIGLVHTTLSFTGATGTAAADFKTNELKMLKDRTGITPTYGFGNTDTDAIAYDAAKIDPAHAYYFKFTGDRKGGVLNDDYTKLASGFSALPTVCK